MMAVDTYMQRNGRGFVAMLNVTDDEMDRWARTSHKATEYEEAADLYGVKRFFLPKRTTASQQREEDR